MLTHWVASLFCFVLVGIGVATMAAPLVDRVVMGNWQQKQVQFRATTTGKVNAAIFSFRLHLTNDIR